MGTSRPPPRRSSHPPSSSPRRSATVRPVVDFGLMTPASRVVEELLAVRPGERVVVVHDRHNQEIARAFEHAATEAGARVTRLEMELLAPRPWLTCASEVIGAVKDADATLLVATNEDGEYDARHALVVAATSARARHVHMVGVSRRAFVGSMGATTHRVFELLQSLRAALRPNSRIVVKSAHGTRLEIDMAPHLRWFANGSSVRGGQWMNVPYGALLSSPAAVNGTYAADAAVGGGVGARAGLLAGRAIRLTLSAGRVTRVECRDASLRDYVERFVAEGNGRERVGLVGLGANIGILAPLGEIIHDENMPGVHLALGETFAQRTGATWTAHGQLAFASAEADVDLDGEPIMRHGRYVRFV